MSLASGSRKPLRTLIVGCGAIAGGYDEAASGRGVLTHAGGYREHTGFDLAGCVDPDEARLSQFKKRWKIADGYADIESALAAEAKYDVVSVCSPTVHHAHVLEALLPYAPRAIFCEKPIADDLGTAERLVASFSSAGIPLAVNYRQRWAPGLEQLCGSLRRGDWGQVLNVSSTYTKGLRHNGTHTLDLLLYFFGPIVPVAVIGRRFDHFGDDPTTEAVLRTESGSTITMLAGDSRMYDVSQLNIATEKGCISIEANGHEIRTRRTRQDPMYPSHVTLGPAESHPTGLEASISRAISQLHGAATSGGPLASSGASALEALRLAESIRVLAKQAVV